MSDILANPGKIIAPVCPQTIHTVLYIFCHFQQASPLHFQVFFYQNKLFLTLQWRRVFCQMQICMGAHSIFIFTMTQISNKMLSYELDSYKHYQSAFCKHKALFVVSHILMWVRYSCLFFCFSHALISIITSA